MATRRITTSTKTHLDQDEIKAQEPKSNIAPAVPSSVIVKLLAFTAAMITLPIGSYFGTVNLLFSGNSTYAGGLAALVANLVLIGYVVVAFAEDQSEREEQEARQKEDGKKSR